MELNLKNENDKRTALIVGGTRDFGLAVAQSAFRSGYSVFTVGRSEKPDCATSNFTCDVMNERDWEETVNEVKERLAGRGIDLIIYVVGYARVYPSKEIPVIEWQRHLWMNFSYVAASFLKLQSLLKANARIATLGSQWSTQKGWLDLAPYISAKHTLATFTEELALGHPSLIFRHYCVPTMDTRGYAEVLNSIKSNHASISQKILPTRLSDPKLIGKALVENILTVKCSPEVLVEIGSGGAILKEPESQTNV